MSSFWGWMEGKWGWLLAIAIAAGLVNSYIKGQSGGHCDEECQISLMSDEEVASRYRFDLEYNRFREEQEAERRSGM